MIQADKEDQEIEESENDDEGEKNPKIRLVSVKKAIDGLKTFISFFEQQNDLEFNVNDLHIFRKYLRVIRVKEINLKKQSTLDLFFNDCEI